MENLFYCAGCGEIQPADSHWRLLWIDRNAELRISPAFTPEAGNHDRDILACGQGSALVLVERWLHTGTFEPAQAHIPQPQPALEGDAAR